MATLNLSTTASPPTVTPFTPGFPAPAASPASTGTYPVGAPLVAPASTPVPVPTLSPQVQGPPGITAGVSQPLVPIPQGVSTQLPPAPVGNTQVTVTATAAPLMSDITEGASPTPLIPATNPTTVSEGLPTASTPSLLAPIVQPTASS